MLKIIECFGTPLNTSYNYCSPFEFEKKYFASNGNFFDLDMDAADLLIANPPFDEDIMNSMADKLIEGLDNKKNKTVLITIPVWDSKTQREYNLKDYGMSFKSFDKLVESKYLKEKDVISKDYKYWDYYGQKYVPVTYTHLILLSNAEPLITLKTIKNKWKSLVASD